LSNSDNKIGILIF